jgi:hypothetical protein
MLSSWGNSWGTVTEEDTESAWGDSWALGEEEEIVPGCVHIDSEVVTNVLIASRAAYYVAIQDRPVTQVSITSESC